MLKNLFYPNEEKFMNIGIDIDGVLNDEKQFCLDYGTTFCLLNKFDYNINLCGWTTQTLMQWNDQAEQDFWTKYYTYYVEKNEYIRPFAAKVIQRLKTEGNLITILSARDPESPYLSGKNLANLTTNWLKNNNIPFDFLFFGINKKQIAEKYHIDIMIEDNPEYIQQLSVNIPILCFHNEHNRNLTQEHVQRVYSWNEIYQQIHFFKKEGHTYD